MTVDKIRYSARKIYNFVSNPPLYFVILIGIVSIAIGFFSTGVEAENVDYKIESVDAETVKGEYYKYDTLNESQQDTFDEAEKNGTVENVSTSIIPQSDRHTVVKNNTLYVMDTVDRGFKEIDKVYIIFVLLFFYSCVALSVNN